MAILGAWELPEVVPLGDFSERTFLSGCYSAWGPGILEKIGKTLQNGQTHTTTGNAVFIAKDFTTVLSMRRKACGDSESTSGNPRWRVPAELWDGRDKDLGVAASPSSRQSHQLLIGIIQSSPFWESGSCKCARTGPTAKRRENGRSGSRDRSRRYSASRDRRLANCSETLRRNRRCCQTRWGDELPPSLKLRPLRAPGFSFQLW